MSDINEVVQTEENLSELRQIKFDKLTELKAAGRDPFKIEKFDVKNYSAEIKGDFDAYFEKTVSIAGRIMSKRIQGKAGFMDLQDSQGRIQVYIKRDDVGEEEFSWIKKYDLGDIVGIKGFVFRTKTEEITVHATEVTLLSKSLQTLPEKYHGLKDQEIRYRQRYVDLIVNPEVKEAFIKRSIIIKTIRNYLDNLGYLEVDTPVLNTIAGGAIAKPFVTHHNTLDIDMFMRISNELYLKRLVVGGIDAVYEMGKMFRNEGMSIRHNPEYTAIELYKAYADYEYMMDLSEAIICECCKAVNNGSLVIDFQGTQIDFTPPWRRVSMSELVKEKTGVDFFNLDFDTAKSEAKRLKLEVKDSMTAGHFVNLAFEEYCEKDLIQPTIVMHHPTEISPLAKKNPDDPRVTNRFEIFAYTWELGNAYSELNDPVDQRERFEAQVAQRASGDEEAHLMDDDFVNALEVGLPPTGGLGIGIDRMIMVLTNNSSIRDIILFPTMKPL